MACVCSATRAVIRLAAITYSVRWNDSRLWAGSPDLQTYTRVSEPGCRKVGASEHHTPAAWKKPLQNRPHHCLQGARCGDAAILCKSKSPVAADRRHPASQSSSDKARSSTPPGDVLSGYSGRRGQVWKWWGIRTSGRSLPRTPLLQGEGEVAPDIELKISGAIRILR